VQLALLQIMAVAVAAGCISRERERGSLDLVMLTRLRTIEVVLGNWLGALSTVFSMFLLLAVNVGIAAAMGAFAPFFAAQYLTVLIAATLSASAGAMLCSTVSSRTGAAVAVALAGAAVPWCTFYSLPTSMHGPDWRAFVAIACAWPFLAAITLVGPRLLRPVAASAFAVATTYCAVALCMPRLVVFLDRAKYSLFAWTMSLEGRAPCEGWSKPTHFGWQHVNGTLDDVVVPVIVGHCLSAAILAAFAAYCLYSQGVIRRPNNRSWIRKGG
jgi:hypothetical protein